jgi:hypothetical protein
MFLQDLQPVRKQVVEIHEIHLALLLRVQSRSLADFVEAVPEEGVFSCDDPFEGFPRVDVKTEDVGQEIPLGEFFRLGIDPEFRNAAVEQLTDIVCIEDGVVGFVTHQMALPAQDEVRDPVKGPPQSLPVSKDVSLSTRESISRAALLVKVASRIRSGFSPVSISRATR